MHISHNLKIPWYIQKKIEQHLTHNLMHKMCQFQRDRISGCITNFDIQMCPCIFFGQRQLICHKYMNTCVIVLSIDILARKSGCIRTLIYIWHFFGPSQNFKKLKHFIQFYIYNSSYDLKIEEVLLEHMFNMCGINICSTCVVLYMCWTYVALFPVYILLSVVHCRPMTDVKHVHLTFCCSL